VQIKWETEGKPADNSPSGTAEDQEERKKRGTDSVSRGGPAEFFFKCADARSDPEGLLGKGAPGTPQYNGWLWVYAGKKNSSRRDLVPASAHEVGHLLTDSDHSSDFTDIMWPEIAREEDPVTGVPPWLIGEEVVDGVVVNQGVTAHTACRVAEKMGPDNFCKGCCEATLKVAMTDPLQLPSVAAVISPTSTTSPTSFCSASCDDAEVWR
jgi:hypothetical protein